MTENNKWKTIDKNDAIDKMVVQGYDLLDAWRRPDHHRLIRNYPARQLMADASRNPAPSAPWLHKSMNRHAGDSYP